MFSKQTTALFGWLTEAFRIKFVLLLTLIVADTFIELLKLLSINSIYILFLWLLDLLKIVELALVSRSITVINWMHVEFL